jgi:hypothetical protein
MSVGVKNISGSGLYNNSRLQQSTRRLSELACSIAAAMIQLDVVHTFLNLNCYECHLRHCDSSLVVGVDQIHTSLKVDVVSYESRSFPLQICDDNVVRGSLT